MKTALFATVILVAGCGGPLPLGTPYAALSGHPIAPSPPGIPAGTPNYLIDGNAGANVPLDTYGITTNGTSWYVEWQNDETPHHFTGDIYCPTGCSLDFIEFAAQSTGATYNRLDTNHFHFDAATAASTHQHLEFDATQQPITFDLSIDGQPATNPYTTFPSSGQLATTASVPFNLISSNAAASNLL